MPSGFGFKQGSGGVHYDGIGTVFKTHRGIRGFGEIDCCFQRGAGFGSFVRSIFAKAIPFLKKKVIPAMSPLLNQAKEHIQDAAANVIEDAVQGENIGESIKKNVTSEGRKLLAKVPEAFAGMLGRDKSSDAASSTPAAKPSTPRPVARKRKKISNLKRIPSKRGRGSTSKFPGLKLFN
jgi:hypothetical protein